MSTSRRNFVQSAGIAAIGATALSSQAKAHEADPPEADIQSFVRLSSVLTGLREDELPAKVPQRDVTGVQKTLAVIYWHRLDGAYKAPFKDLRDVWATLSGQPDPGAALLAKLAADNEAARLLRVAARQVIKIWYLSTIDDPNSGLVADGTSASQFGGDLGQYQQAAIFPAIGAPVIGYSNFTHGYWAQKPGT